MAKNKVAIISSYYQNWNMGGLLQAYALNKSVSKLGREAEHIRLCYAEPAEHGSFSKKMRTVLTRHRVSSVLIERFFCFAQHETKNRRQFHRFHDDYINASAGCCDAITANRLNKRYGAFVTGSDQIWNPQFWSDRLLGVFGLAFAGKEKRTVSYAASIGSEQSAVGKEEVFREILDGLDFISVREDAAKEFLQPLTDKEVKVVLDPTLLMERSEWEVITAKPQTSAPYIFSYFLEEQEPHTKQLQHIAEQKKLPVHCYSTVDCYIRPEVDKCVKGIGPREFVSYIKNADMIVTNSFHGMVFSVIFNKPFWVMKRYKETDKASANNRITDFLKGLGLEDRLIEDGVMPTDVELNRPIDYERVNRILAVKRAESLEWLKNALE